jgi:hypothetical protein
MDHDGDEGYVGQVIAPLHNGIYLFVGLGKITNEDNDEEFKDIEYDYYIFKSGNKIIHLMNASYEVIHEKIYRYMTEFECCNNEPVMMDQFTSSCLAKQRYYECEAYCYVDDVYELNFNLK